METFICNLVTEIQTCATATQWRHCPGEGNPADYLSRGVNSDQWKGLDALWRGGRLGFQRASNSGRAMRALWSGVLSKEDSPSSLQIQTPALLLYPSKYSSYWKLLRVTTWIFRFIQNIRRSHQPYGELTASDLSSTLALDQRDPHIMRLSGAWRPSEERKYAQRIVGCPIQPISTWIYSSWRRLHCAKLSEDLHHPLVLDGKHHFVHLLTWQTQIRLHHLGVRIILSELRELWILRARQAIKVPQICPPCKMAKKPRDQKIEVPLPADPLKPQKSFEVTRIDLTGALYFKMGSNIRKGYIDLFTCPTTRDVHLELCTDTIDKYLLTFQRLVGRRGLPHGLHGQGAELSCHQQIPASATNLCLQLKLTNSSLNTLVGSLSLPGQLEGRIVGEDGRDHESLPTEGTGSIPVPWRTKYHPRNYRSCHQLKTQCISRKRVRKIDTSTLIHWGRVTAIPTGRARGEREPN